jgi:hypothetical protein
MTVFADNGADVWLNGRQLLANSTVNTDAKYWNNRFSVPTSALVAGGAQRCSGAALTTNAKSTLLAALVWQITDHAAVLHTRTAD